jgi:hypothetical protein
MAHDVRRFPHESFIANEFAMLVLGMAILKVLEIAATETVRSPWPDSSIEAFCRIIGSRNFRNGYAKQTLHRQYVKK